MEDSHVASLFALLLSRSVFAPLERAKILLQTSGASNLPMSERYSSLTHFLVSVPKREGFRGYWRGHLANVTKFTLSTVVKFGTHYSLTRFYSSSSAIYDLAIGATAGLVSIVSTYPIDVARVRISADLSKKGAERQFYGLYDALYKTLAEGQVAMFRGMGVCILSSVPFTGLSFAFHSQLLQHLPSPAQGTISTKVLEFFGASSIAVVSAQIICYPLDTLRRRLQVSGSKYYSNANNPWFLAFHILKSEGLKGFYRGCLVNCLKSAPCLALQFTMYEWTLDYMTRLV